MRSVKRSACGLLVLAAAAARAQQPPAPFTLAQIMGYPYPSEMVAAPTGVAIAWVLNERGVRNIWSASIPDWTARQLTKYSTDDGQELTKDRKSVV